MHCLAVLQTSLLWLQVQETDIYSRISPYTDPAIGRITTSPYYQATVDHLKPIAVNGKA